MINLTVQQFMTRAPVTIGEDQNLAAAHRLMREHDIRHLPVLKGGVLVGLVTQRDLWFVETLKDVNVEEVAVSEAMSTEIYTVAPNATVRKIALEMAEHKYGAAIVVDQGHVVGVFTTVDGLRALSALLGVEPDEKI